MTPTPASGKELQALRDEIARTQTVLGTLIVWMVQSWVSPIRAEEAETLLKKLHESRTR